MRNESVNSFSDEEIVRLICEGAGRLFGILVERYQNKIYALGMRFFRNPDDASDFTQDVFVKVYEGLVGFKGRSEKGNALGNARGEAQGSARFFSWLMSIAYNHGINGIKRVRSDESLGEDFTESLAGDPAFGHEKDEVGKALAAAIKDLPEKYGICLDLFFFFGLSHGEISDITGFPVNTIKSHVFRAKALLRKALKGTAAGDLYEM